MNEHGEQVREAAKAIRTMSGLEACLALDGLASRVRCDEDLDRDEIAVWLIAFSTRLNNEDAWSRTSAAVGHQLSYAEFLEFFEERLQEAGAPLA